MTDGACETRLLEGTSKHLQPSGPGATSRICPWCSALLLSQGERPTSPRSVKPRNPVRTWPPLQVA
jgi:hypothetical protein